MKVEVCPDCADIHAAYVVGMYKDLKTPLKKSRSAEESSEARGY